MLGELKKRLSSNDIDAEFTDGAVDAISDAGYDKDYGARPLRRAVQSKIEDMLSEKIIEGITLDEINALMTEIQPATLTKLMNKELTAQQRDKERADRLRESLKNL